jgi:hypothetical protein
MPSYEKNKTQIAREGIAEKVKNKEILNTLAEIAAYTNLSISTIRRAIRHEGLVAGRPVNRGAARYLTTKQNIDIWLAKQHLANVIRTGSDKRPHGKKYADIKHKLLLTLAAKFE